MGFHLSSLLVQPFSLSSRLFTWLFSFWHLLPPPLLPAIGSTCSLYFTSPFHSVIQFNILLSAPSVFEKFLLFYMTYCSFSSCSFFHLFSWVLRYPGFSLSICVCLRSSWGSRLPPSRLPPSCWVLLMFLFFHTSVFLSCDFLLYRLFFHWFSPPEFSAPAFARYCLLSSHALPFLSLGVLVLSASLAFPCFSYAVHGLPSSFFPSCSSLPFRSLGAPLPQSNLRFPPRLGPPFGPSQFPIRFFRAPLWLVVLRSSLGVYAMHLSPSAPLLLLVLFCPFSCGPPLHSHASPLPWLLVWNWVSVSSFLSLVFSGGVSN